MENPRTLQRLAMLVEELLDSSIADSRDRSKFRREHALAIVELRSAIDERFDFIEARIASRPDTTGRHPLLPVEKLTSSIVKDMIIPVLKWLPAAAAVIYESARAWFSAH